MEIPKEENKMGQEVGEILADFENDHDEEKAVKAIFSLIATTRKETLEEVIGLIESKVGVLWNEDNNRYLENIARKNLIDDLVATITRLKG